MTPEVTDQEIREATAIVKGLQHWIENRDLPGSWPTASFTYSTDDLSIMVGDRGVWNRHVNMPEDFTLEYCKQEFVEYVNSLKPFMGDAT